MELKIHDQEILLQKLWKSRKLFSRELRTTSGQKVEVIFAGRENLDTGPDFKDSVIRIDDKLLKGDIEVHLHEAGWYEHRHHQDARYNNVILHLVSEEPESHNLIEREDGVRIHQLWVSSKELQSEMWKTEKKDSPKKAKSSLIVDNCPLSRTTLSQITRTVHEAGYRRFLQKVAQMREDLTSTSWDQLIYKRVLESLGYSKNQIPFRRLADLVSYETVCSEMQWVAGEMAAKKCAALLFGTAGLLPCQKPSRAEVLDTETLDYVAPLEYLWNQLSHRLELKPMASQDWQFFRLRPQNFPTRRIAGLVHLLNRFYRNGFLEGLLKIARGNTEDYDRTIAELETILSVKAGGFWLHHYRFDEAKPTKERQGTALIGRDRAREMVVNIVLPILYLFSLESRDGVLKNNVRELLLRCPKLAENAITRAMRSQLFCFDTEKSREIKSAMQQQGLIHLHKLFCRPLNCSACLQIT